MKPEIFNVNVTIKSKFSNQLKDQKILQIGSLARGSFVLERVTVFNS